MAKRLFGVLIAALVWSVGLASAAPAHVALSARYGSGSVPPPHFEQGAKSHLIQDPAWLALKMANKIHRPGYAPASAPGITSTPDTQSGSVTPYCVDPCPPSSYYLDYSSTKSIWEPQGNNPATGGCTNDAGGNCYTDGYMWKLCGPGSTDVALYYWGKPVFSYSSGAWFSDPHTSTYWNNTYGRAYMMYLATQSYPPSFSSAGEEAYGAYPSAQTYVSDERDTLNWEASGHNTGNWSNYFYGIIWYNQMSSTTFYNDVIQDIWGSGVPPVVVVNAQLLPNWNNVSTTTSHSVAIVGYDATTFTYIDTCGVGCNNKGYANGFYTVLKSQMWAALQNDGTTGALIW